MLKRVRAGLRSEIGRFQQRGIGECGHPQRCRERIVHNRSRGGKSVDQE